MDEDERLDTMFQLNVKGTTQFGSVLVVSGSITVEADGTASKQHRDPVWEFVYIRPPPHL